MRFNPRTYIRYDCCRTPFRVIVLCFNPRTYIRYDGETRELRFIYQVSIHVPI